jgi:hypothetical protein
MVRRPDAISFIKFDAGRIVKPSPAETRSRMARKPFTSSERVKSSCFRATASSRRRRIVWGRAGSISGSLSACSSSNCDVLPKCLRSSSVLPMK